MGQVPISFYFFFSKTNTPPRNLHTYTINTNAPTHAFSRQTHHDANIFTTEKFVKLGLGTILPEKLMLRKRHNH